MPSLIADSFLEDISEWNLLDVNARIGPSGIHGELALEADGLLEEMKRFSIREAVVSHWTAEEYDAGKGNQALQRDLRPRLIPAWAALPDSQSVEELAARRPRAVRLSPGINQHHYSMESWCVGPLCEYLEEHSVVTLIARGDIEWGQLVSLLEAFPRLVLVVLDVGYRADRYLFPLLKRFPHLYFDCATYLAHRQLEAYVEHHGPERILFGTRLPLYTPAAVLGVLASARIPEESRKAIAGDNLRRLLANCRNQPGETQE